MKDHKLIHSFDLINPGKEAKTRMLGAIQSADDAGSAARRGKSGTVRWCMTAAACIAVAAVVTLVPLLNRDVTDPGGGDTIVPGGNVQTTENGKQTNRDTVPEVTEKSISAESSSKTRTTTAAEIAIVPKWDEKTVTERFPALMRNGTEWSASSKTPAASVGKRLGSVTMRGEDVYENKIHTISAEVYALTGVSAECAVAVKFDGYDGFYPYINHLYSPETLGDFINDLNLRENLVFGSLYYDKTDHTGTISRKYSLANPSVIWTYLLSDTGTKNEGDEHYSGSALSISIDVMEIGHKNISLAVSDDGYLMTNILSTAKSFFIGRDKVRRFIDYVLENGTVVEETVIPAGKSGDDGVTTEESTAGFNPEMAEMA